MGYGLPLGLDARQAGIGALVATLKTSEGNGKTQTQCLFLQTEKGSCLYSTAKPGSGVSSSSASSVAGGWLRGKAAGGRDIPAGRRDPRPPLQAQTGANRVRVRSGLRWRKSGNAAGREKTGASKEKQQRSGDDPAEEIIVRERQEERDKGGLDSREFPSPPQDDRRARQERDGACRSPRCRHSASLKTCTQCGRRAQRRGSQEGSDSPTAGAPTRQDSDEKEWQKTEEEEKGALCGLEDDKSISNSDLKSKRFHPESFSGCDAEGMREATSQPELKTQTSHSDFSEEDDDTRPGCMKRHTANKDSLHSRPENSCEEIVVNVNGYSDQVKLAEAEGGLVRGDGGRITSSSSFEDVSFSSFPVSSGAVVSPARTTEPSGPAEGSSAEHEDDMQESSKGEGDAGTGGEDQLGVSRSEANCVEECGNNTVNTKLNNTAQFVFKNEGDSSQQEERKTSIAEKNKRIITDDTCNFSEAELRERDELLGGNREEGVNPEERDEGGERYTCIDVEGVGGEGEDDEDWQPGGKKDDSVTQNCEEVKRKCEVKDGRRIQESADGRTEEEGDTRCVKIETDADVTDDPSTSLALSPANPAPSLPPLGAMATSLPCLEAEEGRVRAAGGGQEGKRRHRRELESPEQQQGEEEAVDTEEGRKEEEDEFGVFMQAEGEPAWSEGFAMSASVPCGSRGSVGESEPASPFCLFSFSFLSLVFSRPSWLHLVSVCCRHVTEDLECELIRLKLEELKYCRVLAMSETVGFRIIEASLISDYRSQHFLTVSGMLTHPI